MLYLTKNTRNFAQTSLKPVLKHATPTIANLIPCKIYNTKQAPSTFVPIGNNASTKMLLSIIIGITKTAPNSTPDPNEWTMVVYKGHKQHHHGKFSPKLPKTLAPGTHSQNRYHSAPNSPCNNTYLDNILQCPEHSMQTKTPCQS